MALSMPSGRISCFHAHPRLRCVFGIIKRRSTTKLLKLYDKVANLLDNTWRKPESWNKQARHAEKLTDWVEENFGQLNIVKIARSVIHYR